MAPVIRAVALGLLLAGVGCRHAPNVGCDREWSAWGSALAGEDTRDPEVYAQAHARSLRAERDYEACEKASPAP